MTVQKFNQLSVDANESSKNRTNLDTLALLVEEIKAVRRALGSASGVGAGMLFGSEVFTIPSIANTAGTGVLSTGATITGAALGDLVLVSSSVSLGGLTVSAYVTATNTVKTAFTNTSGGTLNIGSVTLKYMVIPAANLASLAAMTLAQTAGSAT